MVVGDEAGVVVNVEVIAIIHVVLSVLENASNNVVDAVEVEEKIEEVMEEEVRDDVMTQEMALTHNKKFNIAKKLVTLKK
jgi:hypothetical protein